MRTVIIKNISKIQTRVTVVVDERNIPLKNAICYEGFQCSFIIHLTLIFLQVLKKVRKLNVSRNLLTGKQRLYNMSNASRIAMQVYKTSPNPVKTAQYVSELFSQL